MDIEVPQQTDTFRLRKEHYIIARLNIPKRQLTLALPFVYGVKSVTSNGASSKL